MKVGEEPIFLNKKGESGLYDEIFGAWKREKDSEGIQPLSSDFLQRASEYLSGLKASLPKKNSESIARSESEREVEYAEYMFKNLLKMRIRKIVLLSLEDNQEAITRTLSDNEVALVDTLQKDIKAHTGRYVHASNSFGNPEYRTPLMDSKASGRSPSNLMLVRILQSIPKLVGADLDEYGPFQPEDIVVLPTENAMVLVARGAALEVRPSTYVCI
ncbi:MAG: hypothetical protein WED05_02890 [Candidatus Atabeyarchaeum deiterrae]